jgi:hypothetical protein
MAERPVDSFDERKLPDARRPEAGPDETAGQSWRKIVE